MDIAEMIKAIQYVLAPAVMISAAALLLLGFQNKSSNLANRFRVLNQEKRQLGLKLKRENFEEARLVSLDRQLAYLVQRAFFIRNAIMLTYGAIMGFSAASLLIFAHMTFFAHLYPAVSGVFLLGFGCILAACVFMGLETRLYYQIISLEDSDEPKEIK